MDTYLYREYGYAPRGQQVFARIRGKKYERCGFVATKMADIRECKIKCVSRLTRCLHTLLDKAAVKTLLACANLYLLATAKRKLSVT